jgi:Cu+-exporting ATPase
MLGLNLTGVFTQIFGIDTALLVTFAGGYGIFWDSISRALRGKVGGDQAVTIAAFAAVAIGQYAAAAEVVLIMLVGTALESYAVGRTRGAIAALLKLVPPTATVLRDGAEVSVPVSELVPGDRVIVRPGERISIDGTVVRGESAVDESSLTGESLPVSRGTGDPVYAGTINTLGLLELETSAAGDDTTLAQIIRLVEEAEARKAPVQRMADRWAGYFVPAVLALGGLTFLVWLLLLRAPLDVALTRMASSLIIACPCALILATPTALAAAIGRCARRGILPRGGTYLEAIGRVDCVVFDKTGTLTTGRPEVVEVVPAAGISREELLALAAAAEQGAAHPIAGAILAAAPPGARADVLRSELHAGRGLSAWLSDRPNEPVRIGNSGFLREQGATVAPELQSLAGQMAGQGRTPVFVARGRETLGLIALEDRLRPDAAAVVTGLRTLGIERILLLSGDNPAAVEAAAGRVGIREHAGGLLPADKLRKIRELQEEGLRVAMVGDGINDAPALTAADVGIAMGHGAADIAVEAADVVFVTDELSRLPEAIVISRRALRTIHRSIWWFAIGLNGLSVLLSSTGFLAWLGFRMQDLWPGVFGSGRDLSPILAAVEHQIASLLVVTNSLRLLRGAAVWKPGDRSVPAGVKAPELGERIRSLPFWPEISALPAVAAAFFRRHRRWTVRGTAAAVGVLWLLSGVFTVGPGQVAVVQRFGQLVSADLGPGLHAVLPWPVDRVTVVDLTRVRRAEIGFRTVRTGGETGPTEWSSRHTGSQVRVAEEALVLTGDEYLVDCSLVLQYRVRDAARFLFRTSDPEGTLRQAAEAAQRRAIEQSALETVLTTRRGDLEEQVRKDTQTACEALDLGVEVLSARLEDLHPPTEVVPSYRDVSSAAEEKATAINQAEAYRNETVPQARGQAAQNVALAAGYTYDRTHRSRGEADRFVRTISGYRSGPEVNDWRLYLETVEVALGPPAKFILDPKGGGRRQMWLSDGQLYGLPGLPAAQGSLPAPTGPVPGADSMQRFVPPVEENP